MWTQAEAPSGRFLRRFVLASAAVQCLAASARAGEKPEQPPPKRGLKAEYFAGTDLKNLKLTRLDRKVDFNWNFGRPRPEVPQDRFSIRWIGYVTPRHSEEYTFITASDDGVRLWVDGRKLIDHWDIHGTAEDRGRIKLEAGKKYLIRLEYFENDGHAVMRLWWESRRQKRQIIPPARLSPPDGFNPAGQHAARAPAGDVPSPPPQPRQDPTVLDRHVDPHDVW